MLENLEHAIQETEGQAPNDVATGLTHDDSREAHVGHLGDDVLYLALGVVKPGEREPEGLLNLCRVEYEFLVVRLMKGMSRNHEPRTDSPVPHEFVQLP